MVLDHLYLGVTTRIEKTIDAQGNETIKTQLPDGSVTLQVNGHYVNDRRVGSSNQKQIQ